MTEKYIIEFYAEVARQKQKTIEVTGFEDKASAIEEIKKAMIWYTMRIREYANTITHPRGED